MEAGPLKGASPVTGATTRVSLRGNSKTTATSSQDVLIAAKAERLKRHIAREQPKAALKIQRTWRGYHTRLTLKSTWRQQWLTQYSALAADPTATVTALEMVNKIIPLALLSYLPLPAQRRQRAALEERGQALEVEGIVAALRGALALILRSLSSSDSNSNILGLLSLSSVSTLTDGGGSDGNTGDGVNSKPSTTRIQVVSQLKRVALLCTSLIASPSLQTTTTSGGDVSLLYAASGRILSLLCDPNAWTVLLHSSSSIGSSGRGSGSSTTTTTSSIHSDGQKQQQKQQQGEDAKLWLQRELLVKWMSTKHILATAANRLATNTLLLLPLQPQPHHQQQQQQLEVIKAVKTQKQLSKVLHLLITAQVKLYHSCLHIQQQQHIDTTSITTNTTTTTNGTTSSTSTTNTSTALKRLVFKMLTIPNLLSSSSSPNSTTTSNTLIVLLTQLDIFTAITTCITQHTQQQPLPLPLLLQPIDALHLLANLATVFTTTSTTTTSSSSSVTDIERVSEEASASLVAFSQAAQCLLSTAMLHTTNDKNTSTTTTTTTTTPTAPTSPLLALSVFCDGTFAAKLLTSLPLHQICDLYTSLLAVADTYNQHQYILRLQSALAFGTEQLFLPKLWKVLAVEIGFPLEVPKEASQWNIPSLMGGIGSGLEDGHIQQFGLFCRVYAHYLAVADDIDFHELQQLFTLSEQRAIAATLNTLVFHIHLPSNTTSTTSITTTKTKTTINSTSMTSAGVNVSSKNNKTVLLQYAPRLLRALFERDSRRRFCHPKLWLQPYNSAVKSGTAGNVSGAAVLRSLLQRQSQSNEEDESNSGGVSSSSGQHHQQQQQFSGGGLAELLLQAPHCIPFEERVVVFRELVTMDKQARRLHLPPIEGGPRPLLILIRRTHILEDALSQLTSPSTSLRGPLSITFINAQGLEEAGIDMGGLTKELLETVATAVFDPDRGLFTTNSSSSGGEGSLHPHPLALRQQSGSELMALAGLILGRALYDGVLLDAPLAPFFVSALQGRLPTLDDLASLDPEVHRGLISLKRYDGDASDLGLDFTVESDVFGARVSEELIPGGSGIEVNNGNKLQFVHCVADWHLRQRVAPAAAAFSRGLSRVISPAWLRLFSPREVNQLLGGGEGSSIDVKDWQKHTKYGGGYSSVSHTVKLFWKVLAGMTSSERSAVLKFATSCGRAPLGGFSHLNPPFCIHKVDCGTSSVFAFLGGADVERLPSASTCSNTLKLPNYKKEATMRKKLLYAIGSGAGFELS